MLGKKQTASSSGTPKAPDENLSKILGDLGPRWRIDAESVGWKWREFVEKSSNVERVHIHHLTVYWNSFRDQIITYVEGKEPQFTVNIGAVHSDKEWTEVVKALSKLKVVGEFAVDGRKNSVKPPIPWQLPADFLTLMQLSALRTLEFSWLNFGKVSEAALTQVFQTTAHLRVFVMTHCAATANCLSTRALTTLVQHGTLEIFKISGKPNEPNNKVSGEVLPTLGDRCRNLRELRWMNIHPRSVNVDHIGQMIANLNVRQWPPNRRLWIYVNKSQFAAGDLPQKLLQTFQNNGWDCDADETDGIVSIGEADSVVLRYVEHEEELE